MVRLFSAFPILFLGACAAPGPITLSPEAVTPTQWQSQPSSDAAEAAPDWLAALGDARLSTLVGEALHNNPDLAALREQVEQTLIALRISRADQLPAINLSLSGERTESAANRIALNAGISWDADVWGQLRAEQRQAQLEYAAAQASYRQQREALAATVSQRWFELQEAQLLLALFQERSRNLQRDLEIIESGYRQGINEALDLYLARNDVNAQIARVSQQQQTLSEIQRDLEQLLGRYPGAELQSDGTLPLVNVPLAAKLPASVVARRPDLQASWLNLLAADQALAAAHRARFPRFTLTGTYGGSSETLANVVSSGNLAWSLGASLVQPLFDAGRLKAEQARQAARRRELEQAYLSDLYTAFTEVENALKADAALQRQYQIYLDAEDNALQAEQLAFERYQRGLEEFTTVLEAQRRSLDAQTSVIELRRALLQNRVDLAVALGGGFYMPPAPLETNLSAEKTKI